jgi:hypothetical protein
MGVQNPTTDTEKNGGDDKPLFWRSAQRVEHSADGTRKEHRCFERRVRNGSDQPVYNVAWRVTNYFQGVIPPKVDPCETYSFDGGFQNPLAQGPLHYGIGSQPNYQTQVYVPERGFVGQKDRFGDVGVALQPDGTRLALSSSITLYLAKDPLTFQEILVELKSEVFASAPGHYRYTYGMTHNGPAPLQVQWGFVWDGVAPMDMKTDLRLLPDRPAVVLPGSGGVVFERTSAQPPKAAVGPITITDASGAIVARSLASSYGPSNGAIVDPR